MPAAMRVVVAQLEEVVLSKRFRANFGTAPLAAGGLLSQK